jgi:hypothetical protein
MNSPQIPDADARAQALARLRQTWQQRVRDISDR